jgi:glucose 1-dehydrogenase
MSLAEARSYCHWRKDLGASLRPNPTTTSHSIAVNNIAPGASETPINKNLDEHPEQRQELLSEIPPGRIGRPEDVASMAVYLASDVSSYCTGSTFFVDGGMIRQTGSL